jgi:hypothetical protein
LLGAVSPPPAVGASRPNFCYCSKFGLAVLMS